MQSAMKRLAAILDKEFASARDYVINSVSRHGNKIVIMYTVEWNPNGPGAKKRAGQFQHRMAVFTNDGESRTNDIIC